MFEGHIMSHTVTIIGARSGDQDQQTAFARRLPMTCYPNQIVLP